MRKILIGLGIIAVAVAIGVAVYQVKQPSRPATPKPPSFADAPQML